MVERLSAIVARRVREIRLAAGLTQVQLAERMRIAPGEVSRLEAGRRSPNLDTLEKLGAALGVDPSELLVRHGLTTARDEMAEIAGLVRGQSEDVRRRVVAVVRAMVG